MVDRVVAKSGSDNNNGTSFADAFLTVFKANSVIAPGEKITIHAGTYNERLIPITSGTPGNPIVTEPNSGDTVFVRRIRTRENAVHYNTYNNLFGAGDTIYMDLLNNTNIIIDNFTAPTATGNNNIKITNSSYCKFINGTYTGNQAVYQDYLFMTGSSNHNVISGNTFLSSNTGLGQRSEEHTSELQSH